jgi:phospholipid/cholesterol/gamma-HCH transport system substrate-binding protein
MQKQAPGAPKILAMVLFVLSCVGLLVFLWTSFGGSIPLAARGYRFEVEFEQAVQLAAQSDVRISGVSVGKVVSVGLDKHTGLEKATIEIESQYAPRPADTRAILRQKSVLGETYVELSPGSANGPKLPDGGTLPRAQVAPTVQLDQILSTFDPVTRKAFQVWMQQGGLALTGRGQDFNSAFAQLYPFATNVEAVLAVLNRDNAATTTLLHDGAQVFSALSSSPSQLQGLITNSNSVFAVTAAQDTALANAVKAFPAFTVATRVTVSRVTQFADTTRPLIDELRPAAVQLSPALEATAVLAPTLLKVMTDLAPLTSAATPGIPAIESFLKQSVPWLARQTPYLGGIIPVINYLNDYRREIAAFFANSAVTTQGTLQNNQQTKLLHYLRISNPVNPETLTSYQHRLSSNRGNPYMVPGGYDNLLQGLFTFSGYLCTSNAQPEIGPTVPADLAAILQSTYYTTNPGGPPCRSQSLLGTATTGQLQVFPHLQPLR